MSERVPAPSSLSLPADADGVRWRAASPDDFEAIHEIELEIGVADHPHFTVPYDEVVDDFEAEFVDIDRDSIVAVDSEGVLLAWGLVLIPPGQETLVRSIPVGGVRPSARGRGIGRELFGWQRDRAMQQLAASGKSLPGWIVVSGFESAPSATRLFERFGLSVARYFLELARDLSEPIADAPLDPQTRLASFTPEWYAKTLEARNVAFMDHWGSQPTSEDSWDRFTKRSIRRGDLSSLAIGERDGIEEVAGLVLASVTEEDWPAQGFSSAYIDLVGVTRPWRKRGIAASLLTTTLRLAAADGLDKVVLDVDADSPTGALGLYERLGFTESHRSMAYTEVF